MSSLLFCSGENCLPLTTTSHGWAHTSSQSLSEYIYIYKYIHKYIYIDLTCTYRLKLGHFPDRLALPLDALECRRDIGLIQEVLVPSSQTFQKETRLTTKVTPTAPQMSISALERPILRWRQRWTPERVHCYSQQKTRGEFRDHLPPTKYRLRVFKQQVYLNPQVELETQWEPIFE